MKNIGIILLILFIMLLLSSCISSEESNINNVETEKEIEQTVVSNKPIEEQVEQLDEQTILGDYLIGNWVIEYKFDEVIDDQFNSNQDRLYRNRFKILKQDDKYIITYPEYFYSVNPAYTFKDCELIEKDDKLYFTTYGNNSDIRVDVEFSGIPLDENIIQGNYESVFTINDEKMHINSNCVLRKGTEEILIAFLDAINENDFVKILNLIREEEVLASNFYRDRNILMYQIIAHNSEIARLLIERGADIHAVNNTGWTALMLATKYNQPENAILLIERGAEINVVNNSGNTVIEIALQYSFQVYKYILSNNLD